MFFSYDKNDYGVVFTDQIGSEKYSQEQTDILTAHEIGQLMGGN